MESFYRVQERERESYLIMGVSVGGGYEAGLCKRSQ